MHRLLAALSLAFLFHASPVQVIDRVQASVLRITGTMGQLEDEDQQAWRRSIEFLKTVDNAGPNYVCTGFVIAPHKVLTAAHCTGKNMTADGIPAKIVKGDEYYDLLLLDVATDKKPLKLRENVDRYEMLNGVGYAWGWTLQSVLVQRAFLIDVSPYDGAAPGLITQFGFIGGQSGGPVVDKDGNVVSMVQQSNQGVGYGVGSNLIKAFLVGVKL